MENPTPKKGRAFCVRFAHASQEAISLSALRIQHIQARHGLAIETAAIIAALAWEQMHHG